MSHSVDNPATISNGTFKAEIADSDGTQFIFEGKLTSGSDASGTLEVKGNSNNCGPFDGKTNWTAKKGAATTQSASAAPTDAPSTADSTATEVPPISDATPAGSDADVVKAFFGAVNAKDVDGALAMVDDNVIYTIGKTNGIGADGLRTFIESQANAGTRIDVSGISTDLVSVNFSATMGGVSLTGSAIVQDGKIVILKLQ
jgi:limonene-1,2-epoxide hydrolase